MLRSIFSQTNILLLSILAYYLYTHYKTNLARAFSISPIQNEMAKDRCEVIRGPTGCEDIIIPRGENFGILGCGPDVLYKKTWGKSKYRNLAKNPEKQDELDKFYHFDLETSQLIEVPVKNLPNGHTLYVHGFDMIADPKEKGSYLLYTINHMRNSSETIEKFHYDSLKKELNWFGTEYGTPDSLVNPNGLAFVDSNNYLVTRFIKGGDLTLFSPNNISIIADSIAFANGVVSSKDGKLLFVASSLGVYLDVFKISKDKDNNIGFNYLDRIPVDVMPDNLNLDSETGDIFVTGIVKPIESLIHLATPGLPKKEQNVAFRVIRVKIGKNSENKDKYEFKTETVLEHDGTIHKMATVSAPHSKLNRLLIGTLFTEGVLNCKLNP